MSKLNTIWNYPPECVILQRGGGGLEVGADRQLPQLPRPEAGHLRAVPRHQPSRQRAGAVLVRARLLGPGLRTEVQRLGVRAEVDAELVHVVRVVVHFGVALVLGAGEHVLSLLGLGTKRLLGAVLDPRGHEEAVGGVAVADLLRVPAHTAAGGAEAFVARLRGPADRGF